MGVPWELVVTVGNPPHTILLAYHLNGVLVNSNEQLTNDLRMSHGSTYEVSHYEFSHVPTHHY